MARMIPESSFTFYVFSLFLAKRIANKDITLPDYNKDKQIQRPIFHFYVKIKISDTTSNGFELDKYYQVVILNNIKEILVIVWAL